MALPLTIAIDGPAASGKTTLAEIIAERLGYLFFDTGVMYRAMTLAAIQKLCFDNIEKEEALTKLTQETDINVTPPSINDGRKCDVYLNGVDVTNLLHIPEVDAKVSQVSALPQVRDTLTSQQRIIGLRGNVVMVGRDIGTVVLPEADLKIFLDASLEERAVRRYKEVSKRDEKILFSSVLESLKQRDHIDSTRKIAPLLKAKDAIVINSDGMNIEQVVAKVMESIRQN